MSKLLLTTLLTILFISTVFAIEVNELDGAIPTNPSGSKNIDVQLIQKIATLENKISLLASKEDVEQQTAFIYNNLAKKFANKTDILILSVAFLQLFQMGLAYSIFLYLKSQRRV